MTIISITRPLSTIARDICNHWDEPYYAAKPYLRAMLCLSNLDEKYIEDSASSIVCYFLANASTWRGEHARRIKKELNDMLKVHRKGSS